MIKLKKLSFKGIGRFVDTQEISFEGLSNLVQIDGKNNNTGGSSGSAKSTVFNALDFLFGLNSIPNSMLQSRLTEDSIFVEGEFDLDGQALVISRGKKLKIVLNGDITTGSSKVTEEKLDQIIAIPRHLFRPMLHKKQREPGFFLSFTPAEMNSFLTDCLGLSDFKGKIDSLDKKIADLSKMISSLTSALEANYSGLKASTDAIATLGSTPIKEVDQNAILHLKRQLELATNQLNDVSEKHVKELKSLENSRPTLQSFPFDSTELKRLEKELDNIVKERDPIKSRELEQEHSRQKKVSEHRVLQAELNDKIRRGKEAKEEATKCAAEILKIRNSICPRCEQSWVNETAKLEEEKILNKINALKGTISVGEISSIQLETAQEKLDYELSAPLPDNSEYLKKLDGQERLLRDLYLTEKKKEEENRQRELNINRSKLDAFTEQEKLLRQMQNSEKLLFQGQIDIHRRSLEIAAMKFKSYEDMKVRYDNSLKALEVQQSSYDEKITDTLLGLQEVNTTLAVAEELKKAIKSYLSCSFDEALETISENATKMIQSIPNMANATIQLEGTKETKDGKVKEEVNAIIHMDGEENVPVKTLCGGERASADIAIDLAALGLIEDRTNKGIDIFCLDEPFTGLDSTNIEMVLEVLKNANTHKKLIVVDHNPVVKEQISDRITVIRDGLTSRVTQN